MSHADTKDKLNIRIINSLQQYIELPSNLCSLSLFLEIDRPPVVEATFFVKEKDGDKDVLINKVERKEIKDEKN